MAMLGGLDCIAMAVEHLERTESGSGAAPVVDPSAFDVRRFNGCTILPKQTAFAQQPRVVSDTEDLEKELEDAKCIEELRKLIFQIDLVEWKNMPSVDTQVITTITSHDVLCGRGGETNHHKGNITFRACVKACQPAYIEAKRRDKPYIAQRIVLFVRKMGGRFLKRERDTNVDAWKDVGNNKAREKTSQALREGAPELRGDVKEGTGSSSKGSNDFLVEYESFVPNLVTVPSTFHMEGAPNMNMNMHHHLYTSGTYNLDPSRRPVKKQRCVSLFDVADTSVAFHRHALLPVVSKHPIFAPGSPRVTVSADEEERSHPSPTAGQSSSSSSSAMMMTHGPRLKLLKKRFSIDVNTMY